MIKVGAGGIVRELQGSLADSSGVIVWDQKDKGGKVAASGDYMIIFTGKDGKRVKTRVFLVH